MKKFDKNEIEEAAKKRKKRLLIEILISLAIAAVGIVLAVIGIVKQIIPLTIAGVAVVLFAVVFFKIINSRSQKYCLSCGKSLNGCEYSYQEINRQFTSSNGDCIDVNVHIRAVCPHCGAVKVFTKKFTVAPGYNIQHKVDEFCQRKFGH